jgi:hypothetical protein
MSLLFALWLSTVLPKGTILLKGAAPAASDASTPVPENGRVDAGRYRNAYFGLSYPIPAGWAEQPAGPPPSDRGMYVLTSFAIYGKDRLLAHVLVTAQDLFFTPGTETSAQDVVAAARGGLAPVYVAEDGVSTATIAGRTFHRLAYRGPHSGLHARMLSTDTRCHALTFTFMSPDPARLDAAEQALRELTIHDDGPVCIRDYAREHVLEKTDPKLPQRYNTIPVRILIDAAGRVQYAHVISAFPEQVQPILDALRMWRFQPYRVNGKAVPIETGLVFGYKP